jgi:hypothetical protein
MYIAPVSGTGSTQWDNAAFTGLLSRELSARNIFLKATPDDADYSLVGVITSVGTGSPDTEAGTAARYHLSITLKDKNGLTLYEQGFNYTTVGEGNSYIPTLLFNMLENVFSMQVTADVYRPQGEEEIDRDAWRNKQWYFGVNAFWDPRIYAGSTVSSHLLNFGFGFSAEFHFQQFASEKREFLKYLSLGTGMELAPEWVIASPRSGDEYRNTIIQIPLVISGVLRPGDNSLHEPYAGIQFNIPLFTDTVPPLLSWKAGFQYGVKAGPGVLNVDARFSMDFGKAGLMADRPAETRQYDRYMIYLGLGYKYDLVGLIQEFLNNR